MATGQLRPFEEDGSASEHPTDTSIGADGSPELTNAGSHAARTPFPAYSGFDSQVGVMPSAIPAQWGATANIASHTQSAIDAGLSGPNGGGTPGMPSASNWQDSLFAGLDSVSMNPSLSAALGMLGGGSGSAQNSAKDAIVSQLNGYLGALGVGDAGETSVPSGTPPDVNLGSHNPSLYGADGTTDGGVNGSSMVGPQDSRVTALLNGYSACNAASVSLGPFDVSCTDVVAGLGKGLSAPLSNPARDAPDAPKEPLTVHAEAVDQQNKQNETSSPHSTTREEQSITDSLNQAQDKSWQQAQEDKAVSASQDKQKEEDAKQNAVNDPPPGQATAMYDPDLALGAVDLSSGAVDPRTAQQVASRAGQAEHTINPDDGTDPSEPVDVSSATRQPGQIDPKIANVDSELCQSTTGTLDAPKFDTAPIDNIQGWDEQNPPGGSPGHGGSTPDNAEAVPH